MKMKLPFGDWSDDGHGKYEVLIIEAPTMDHLLIAQEKIKAIYGKDFFSSMADEYEDARIGENVRQALLEHNVTIEQMAEWCDDCGWERYGTLKDAFESEDFGPGYHYPLSGIENIFVFMLNEYGAQITVRDDDVPMICNWTCHGFETVGYGCFW